jgi:hypothetical protein
MGVISGALFARLSTNQSLSAPVTVIKLSEFILNNIGAIKNKSDDGEEAISMQDSP